ncbi:TSUP family transporter [Sulfurimonas diazotrophicus]|uniref:Probable membrane transporter protein n=1 Tax=Sulfurimonas diazotrophicus TaxID=3131939 RepID=A0ABZ3H9Q6_9BACT
MEISIEMLMFLFAASIVAGTMDTMVGGGGLITLPSLMLTGLSPINALGTNKLQGCIGTGTATFLLLRKSKIRWRHIRPLFIAAFVGSVIGTVAVQFISQHSLSLVIPVVLVLIIGYFLLYNPSRNSNFSIKMGAKKFTWLVVPGIGFYDGMFGPGTGSFFSFANVLLRRAKLVAATATAKPLNFATNVSSLLVFILFGNVVWHVGLVMMLGQAVGAWLGVHLLYKINPQYLRSFVIAVCLLMLAKYIASS